MNMSESQQVTQNATSSKITLGVLVATLFWCAIPFSPNTVDSDFWGHVQYGQDTLDYGLSYTSTYTYTAEGYRWINHENLSEVVFGWIVQHLGTPFILVLKCVCGCLVIGLIMQNGLKKRVSALFIVLASIVIAINLSFYWGVRPQFFSFTFFAILIAFDEQRLQMERLSRASTRNILVRLLIVFTLFFVWTNTHGGFVAGAAVFCVLMLGRALICLLPNSQNRNLAAVYGAFAGTAMLATLINPYGINLHLWLFDSLRIPRPEIAEWHAPELFQISSLKIWAVIVLSVLSVLFSRLKKDVLQITVFSLVLFQTLSHQRHLPFLCILFGFWVPVHLQDFAKRVFGSPDFRFSPQPNSLSFRLSIGALLAICGLHAVQLAERLKPITVSTERYPIDAVQFMKEHNLSGPIIVSGEWAQYLIGVSGARTPEDPGFRVAFDGRFRTCYPQTVVDMHFDFFTGKQDPTKRFRSAESKEVDPTRILSFESPQLVLIKDHEYQSVQTLQQNSKDWICLYRDGVAQLWGKTALYDDPQSADYLMEEERLHRQLSFRQVRWPGAPENRQNTRNVSLRTD